MLCFRILRRKAKEYCCIFNNTFQQNKINANAFETLNDKLSTAKLKKKTQKKHVFYIFL